MCTGYKDGQDQAHSHSVYTVVQKKIIYAPNYETILGGFNGGINQGRI